MYAASVTAYGHITCWEKNPETKYPGTTGDYRYVNAPAAQQPKYDSLVFPGDELVNYVEDEPEATPTPTPAPTPTPVPVAEKVRTHPLVLFVKEQPVVSGAVGLIVLAILVINIILFVRVRQLRNSGRKRRGKVRKPSGPI